MLGLSLGSGTLLGWALGANDAANVFGTAVASKVITFRMASILCACAVIVGAYLQGTEGLHTYSALASQNSATLIVATFSAAIAAVLMTILRLPISTSQAIVGAITGIGLATDSVNAAGLKKVLICWLCTPVGAMLISIAIFYCIRYLFRTIPMSMLTRDNLLYAGLVLFGVYGSYAIGANNVANVTGIFSGQLEMYGINDGHLVLIGGSAIALGVFFSERVMTTVGSGVMKVDALAGLVAVASMSFTVHLFAIIGVPVSTSQGIIGGLLGVGLIRGIHTIRFKGLKGICYGWFVTPCISLILSAAGYAIFC